MRKDTIYREDVINLCEKWRNRTNEHHDKNGWYIADTLLKATEELPPADRPTWLKTEIVEEYNGLYPDGITKVKSNATKREKEMFEYGYKCGMNDSDRPQGEWLLSDLQSQADNDNGNYAYVCTNCNHTDIHAKTQKVPYCWWCGAKMLKGANNERVDL